MRAQLENDLMSSSKEKLGAEKAKLKKSFEQALKKIRDENV